MRSFEEIPDIAERIKRSKMELQESGFYWAPEWDSQSCCDQDYVNNFKKGWESRQTEVDELQKRVDAVKKQVQNALQYVEGDMRENHEFLKMAMIRTFKELEQALKGGEW